MGEVALEFQLSSRVWSIFQVTSCMIKLLNSEITAAFVECTVKRLTEITCNQGYHESVRVFSP